MPAGLMHVQTNFLGEFAGVKAYLAPEMVVLLLTIILSLAKIEPKYMKGNLISPLFSSEIVPIFYLLKLKNYKTII